MQAQLITPTLRSMGPRHLAAGISLPRRVGLLCGSGAILLGLLVLLGWAIHASPLLRITPDLPAMPWPAAICFILMGLADLGIATGKQRLTIAGSALAACLAAASLLGAMMSLATAVCFIVLAAGFVMAGRLRQRFWLLGVAGLLATAISAVCASSMVWGGGDAFGLGGYGTMALHSAFGFILLGVGSFAIAVDASLAALQMSVWAPVGTGLALAIIRFALLRTFAPKHYTSASLSVAVAGALLGAVVFGLFVHLALQTYLQRDLLRTANARLGEEILERQRAENLAQAAHTLLEQRVEERTWDLETANQELRHEIARREHVEDDLRRQQEILQTIFDNVPLGINSVDNQGRIQMVNREWERMVGRSWKEIIEQKVDFYVDCFPDPVERQRARDFVANSTSEWKDFESKTPGGDTVHSAWTFVGLSDGSRIGIGQDITARKRAERELRQQKEILQTIFDHIPVMINFGDSEYNLKLANREWEQTLGWSVEDVRDSHVDLLVENYPDPEYRERVRDFVVHSNGEWADFKTRVRDGRVIDTSWAMLHLPDGITIGIGQDITRRKRAEEALRESEERFRQLAENIHDLFWIKTPDLKRVLYLSPAYKSFTGRLPEQRYQEEDYHSFLELIVPEDRPKIAAILERGLASALNTGLDIEYRLRRPDGEVRWIHDRAFPIRDESGQVYRVAGIASDITDRKIAEDALRESEERFRQLTENIHEVFWLRSPDFQDLLYVSPLYEKVCGKTLEAIYAAGVDLDAVHPEDRGIVAATMRDRAGQEFEIEYRIQSKDGTFRWLRDRGFPIRNAAGQIYRMGGVAEDITDRKKSEEQLTATTEQLRALSASLQSAREAEATRIAHQIHDEMGGILTALRWELEALAKMIQEPANPEQLKGAMPNKLATMLGLTDTTINVVRRIASELRPSILDDLGLLEAIEWQAQQFQSRTGIECRSECVPHAVSLSDRQATALFRIFQEALTNILRHAQATRVTVAMEEEDRTFVLTVRDNGRGITQAEKASRDSLGILGMRERANLIGGQVDIIGEEGAGTTLCVRVPLGDETDARGEG